MWVYTILSQYFLKFHDQIYKINSISQLVSKSELNQTWQPHVFSAMYTLSWIFLFSPNRDHIKSKFKELLCETIQTVNVSQ